MPRRVEEFSYSHLLAPSRPIGPGNELLTKACRRCGATFTTASRVKKRCDECQAVVDRGRVVKSNERRNKRRRCAR